MKNVRVFVVQVDLLIEKITVRYANYFGAWHVEGRHSSRCLTTCHEAARQIHLDMGIYLNHSRCTCRKDLKVHYSLLCRTKGFVSGLADVARINR